MKSTSLTYRAIKAILTVVGQIEIHGCPIPFLKKARGFDIGGAEQRAVMELLRPGDVMLGRYTNHLTSVLIPGRWDHAAIYVGDNQVVHITGDGVSEQDVLEFMERDGVAVLRIPHYEGDPLGAVDLQEIAVQSAVSIARRNPEYDYVFDFLDSTRYSCSELVRECLYCAFEEMVLEPNIDLQLQLKAWGKMAYTPDDLFNSGLTVIHESKAWRKENK